MIDLVILVADTHTEAAVSTLLQKRCQSLQIRSLKFEVVRGGGDANVYQQAQDLLRGYTKKASYALVLLDREGSGQEARKTAEQIESELEERLKRNGWSDERGSRCAVIVLDPELEVWVWSRSPHVPEVLELNAETLKQILDNFERNPNGKPRRPKEALQAALRRARRPLSAAIFRELAERVSLQAEEQAFHKFRSTLQSWFPMETNV